MKNKIKTGATILIAGLLVCTTAYALTNIVMAEQSSDPMSGSEVGLWAGNTAGTNEAWWRRDDGSSVDLSAVGGTSTIELHDNDSASKSSQSSGGAGAETIKTVTLTGGTLAANGNMLEIHAFGQVDASTGSGNKSIELFFGSVRIGRFVQGGTTAINWEITARLTRTGTGQVVTVTNSTWAVASGLTATVNNERQDFAQTIASDVLITIKGTDTNSEDSCTCDALYAKTLIP